jgi:hypothetical protein
MLLTKKRSLKETCPLEQQPSVRVKEYKQYVIRKVLDGLQHTEVATFLPFSAAAPSAKVIMIGAFIRSPLDECRRRVRWNNTSPESTSLSDLSICSIGHGAQRRCEDDERCEVQEAHGRKKDDRRSRSLAA